MRKTEHVLGYVEVASLPAGTTTYMETVVGIDPNFLPFPEDGLYWYRVFAVNAEGDSFGSNVVFVDASQ